MKKQHFTKQIFMGNSCTNCTETNVLKLQELLNIALCELSFIQKTNDMQSEFIMGDIIVAEDIIYNAVRDIAIALTGKKIKFIKNGKN